ncbi:MAG TPA: hypothetical protein VK902_06865 [Rubrobacter sp.]|nr:hypothetical protein [Rubrobacter sp.]
MIEEKSRSELFGEVLIQLHSVVEEAGETGSDGEASYVREVLIPFLDKERFFAEMLEEQ